MTKILSSSLAQLTSVDLCDGYFFFQNLTNQFYRQILRLRERSLQQNREQGDGSDGQIRFNLVMQCPYCLRYPDISRTLSLVKKLPISIHKLLK